jgi:hypothetical protein
VAEDWRQKATKSTFLNMADDAAPATKRARTAPAEPVSAGSGSGALVVPAPAPAPASSSSSSSSSAPRPPAAAASSSSAPVAAPQHPSSEYPVVLEQLRAQCRFLEDWFQLCVGWNGEGGGGGGEEELPLPPTVAHSTPDTNHDGRGVEAAPSVVGRLALGPLLAVSLNPRPPFPPHPPPIPSLPSATAPTRSTRSRPASRTTTSASRPLTRCAAGSTRSGTGRARR